MYPLQSAAWGIGMRQRIRELERLELVPRADLLVERKNPNASLLVRINDRKEHIRLSNELADHVLVRGR